MNKGQKKRGFHLFANWKMYALGMESQNYFEQFFNVFPEDRIKDLPPASIGFAAPFTKIQSIFELLSKRGLSESIVTGAQNMHSAKEGAFTGEIAYALLKEAKAQWVLLGHSERRSIFNESDEQVALKMQRCDEEQFPALLCVGETAVERKEGKGADVVTSQLLCALEQVKQRSQVWVAYEPVWAIGTGESASTEQVKEMHQAIYEKLLELGFEEEGIRIFYGGSVNEGNCEALAATAHVDGFLVGKASLKPEVFATIAQKLL